MSGTVNQIGGLPLFEPRARNSDPVTSHQAAESMMGEAQGQRANILAALTMFGPMTADELDEKLDLRDTSAGRRLPELAEMGLVERLKDMRRTRSNRQAHIWRALP